MMRHQPKIWIQKLRSTGNIRNLFTSAGQPSWVKHETHMIKNRPNSESSIFIIFFIMDKNSPFNHQVPLSRYAISMGAWNSKLQRNAYDQPWISKLKWSLMAWMIWLYQVISTITTSSSYIKLYLQWSYIKLWTPHPASSSAVEPSYW